jgi:hypothetical protein
MHALDLTNYISAHPNPTMAQLSSHGITFTNASTTYMSDSFPGLASLVMGGSPTTTGLWYDVSFNRKLSPPAQTTLNGIPGGANLCPGTVGTALEYAEHGGMNEDDVHVALLLSNPLLKSKQIKTPSASGAYNSPRSSA